MNSSSQKYSGSNWILSALPREEYYDLSQDLEAVRISSGQMLYHAGDTIRHAYFFDSGQICLLSMTTEGMTLEVGTVGKEGVIGVSALLGVDTMPMDAMVRIPSISGVRIRTDILKRQFDRGAKLQCLLLRYMHFLFTQITQSVICNRFHTLDQRLCRWLLMASDIVADERQLLTHELIGGMLGTPRTGITMAANSLQRNGLIRYSRGRLNVLNRKGLEELSCECYGIVREETTKYFQTCLI